MSSPNHRLFRLDSKGQFQGYEHAVVGIMTCMILVPGQNPHCTPHCLSHNKKLFSRVSYYRPTSKMEFSVIIANPMIVHTNDTLQTEKKSNCRDGSKKAIKLNLFSNILTQTMLSKNEAT